MSGATTFGARRDAAGAAWDRDRVASAFPVSRETLAALDTYVELLAKWQKQTSLIGRGTEADIWGRHVADSLQLVALAPAAARTWIDLGSGAGLPGLVVAIALRERPGFTMHLVEANGRKCAFLRVAAAATAAPVQIHPVRIETFAVRTDRPQADVVSARALAPLPKLLALAAPFMWKSTVLILPKGQDVERELTDSSISWKLRWDAVPSRTDPAATILRIEEAVRHAL